MKPEKGPGFFVGSPLQGVLRMTESKGKAAPLKGKLRLAAQALAQRERTQVTAQKQRVSSGSLPKRTPTKVGASPPSADGQALPRREGGIENLNMNRGFFKSGIMAVSGIRLPCAMLILI